MDSNKKNKGIILSKKTTDLLIKAGYIPTCMIIILVGYYGINGEPFTFDVSKQPSVVSYLLIGVGWLLFISYLYHEGIDVYKQIKAWIQKAKTVKLKKTRTLQDRIDEVING